MVFFLPLQKHNSKSSFEHLAVQTEKRTENVLMNESRCKILLNHCMFQISPAQIYCSAARRTFFFFCRFYRNIQFLCLYNRCRAILLMEMLLINPYYYYNHYYYYYYYHYYYYYYYYYYHYYYYYYYCYTCLFISSISLVAWVFTAFASSLLFCSCSCTASSCALMD